MFYWFVSHRKEKQVRMETGSGGESCGALGSITYFIAPPRTRSECLMSNQLNDKIYPIDTIKQ